MATERPAPTAHGGRWSVQLFGQPRARHGSIRIDDWRQRAETLLFARLVLEPQTAHAREDLAAWLWPEIGSRKGRGSSDEAAIRRTRLRHALSNLNLRLQAPGLPPDGAFIADRRSVQIHAAAFETDVQAFEACLARGDLEAARALMHAELLAGLSDPWIDAHRARLRAALQAGAQSATIDPPADADDRARTSSPSALLPYNDTFFGRETETAALRAMVQACRVVAICGPGGAGKTRLAAHAGAAQAGFDCVVFVALAPHREPLQLFEHIRDALQVQAGALPAIKQVQARLSGQRALLVLDNFEQMVGEEGRAAIAALLLELPQAHLLLTSVREPDLPGCATLALSPLPLPEAGDDLKTAARNPAVALFVARAGEVRDGFKLTARNRAGIIQACQALEGLPLAIELAASRVREISPREIGLALGQGAAVPARSGARARKDRRHASLQAVLDWTWGLLSAAQRGAWMDLAHLRGDFTDTQAAAVAGSAAAAAHDSSAVAALLASLVRDSVLQPCPDNPLQPRWRMLNAVRDYALERVPAARAEAARRRHLQHFEAQAAATSQHGHAILPADVGNLVAAGEGALQAGEAPRAVVIARALARYAAWRGAVSEALDFLQQAATRVPPQTPGHAELRVQLPRLFVNAGRAQAAQALATAALGQAAGSQASYAEALLVHTHVRWLADRNGAQAREPAQQALHLSSAAGATEVQARAQILLGALALTQGDDVPLAAAHFREAERLFAELGEPRGEVLALPGLAACHLWEEEFGPAMELARDGEARAAELGDVTTQLQLCNRLSESLTGLRQFDEALAVCQRQVRLARAHGMAYHVAYGLWNECLLLVHLRQPEKAARLMAFSKRYWETQFGALDADDERYVERVRRRVIAQIGLPGWRSAYDKGLAIDEAEGLRLGSG